DEKLVRQGVTADLAALRQPWLDIVRDTFEEATLPVPDPDAWMQRGGKRGRHSEHLGYLLAEMQFVQRAYPGATW
ncbi:MAG: Phenylacetic acid catabolic protein, partial [Geminicoccaceae bacterium]